MITCSGISFHFPDAQRLRTIFANMDAEFASGLFHVVMGPSGSGKTTLLNLLDGSLNPEKGVVKIAGKPVSDFALKDLRGKVLARVFQDYRLIPYLSACDNIRLAQQVAGTLDHNPDTAAELLQRLGLGNIAD